MLELVCGPMATLSHQAFRMLVEGFGGCDCYFTEMINAASLLNLGPFEKYYLLDAPVPEKIVWQLTGNKIEPMVKAASLLAHKNGVGVDLNMGCSAPQIYKTGAGIAWMLKPLSESLELVRGIKSALDDAEKECGVHKRLSVKCRLGADDFTDKSFFDFVDMLFSEGVEALTLHPRTLKERLIGKPKYSYAEEVALRYPALPVYVNGEICDCASADFAMEKVPHAKGLMVARAAAQKPWIFRELKSALSGEKKDGIKIDRKKVALDFVNYIEDFQPPEFYKTRIQRFFSYYCDNFSFGHYFKTQILNYHSLDETRKKIEEYFDKVPDDREVLI